MKAELRIGTWVHHKSTWSYRQPDEGPFTEFDFQWTERDWYAIGEACLFYQDVEPIPLTEEWLLKLGFEDVFGYGSFRWETERYMLERWTTTSNWMFRLRTAPDTSYPLAEIAHVHQLQNLYFCLTGEELTIKP